MTGHLVAAPTIAAVDLFCGVGGLTHGLIRGGIQVKAGVDVDVACRFPFEANNSAAFVEQDVGDLSAADLFPFLAGSELTLLAGCAPCQPFSTYSQGGRSRKRGSQWQLVSSFGRLVEEVRPHLVTMENVPQLADHEVFDDFMESLRGYEVHCSVAECSLIGVPQSRRRLVLLASRLGLPAPALSLRSRAIKTVRDTISGLPAIRAGEQHAADPLLRRTRCGASRGSWCSRTVDRGPEEDLRARVAAAASRSDTRTIPGLRRRRQHTRGFSQSRLQSQRYLNCHAGVIAPVSCARSYGSRSSLTPTCSTPRRCLN